MRIAAFSDIHANLPALEAVLEDIARLGPDVRLVVAGDFLNCGPWPRQTLELIRSLPNAIVIAGNHEEYILEKSEARQGQPLPTPYRALFAPASWTASQLTSEEMQWLTDLPRQASFAGPDGSDVQVVHGSPRHQTECLYPEMEEARLAQIFGDYHRPARLWIAGHTHRPALLRWGGMTIVNNGSVGASYDGDHRASYTLAEWDEKGRDWRVEHRRVSYDYALTSAALLANTVPEQGGPYMRLVWYNLQIAATCNVREFVNSYLALGQYPPPPDDFAHLDAAITRHLSRWGSPV